MWDIVVFGLAFAVLFIFGAWKSYKSGEFTKFIDHMKLASSVNDDLFDGETKTFVVSTNGSEHTVAVKTKKDAIDKLLIPSTRVSKLYF